VTNADIRSLLVALSLLSAFLLVEVLMAILSDSLALLADAGHMLTDVAALSMSAWAIRLARRPPQGRWTFGLKRAEILSAAVNGVTLLAIALLIAVEAVQRLLTPRHVDGGVVLTVAILGATINVLVGWILSRADRTSLNIRGAYLHIITDLFAFIATAIAGLVIVLTRWEWADAIASMFVVALMLVTSWGLLRDAGKILLQASPDNLDLNHVRGHLVDVDHVLDVHDLHAWTVTSGQTTLSAHVVVEDHCFDRGHAPQILDALQQCLIDHFDIEHATFQLEPPAHEAHEEGLHP
jgi:cobalt-zinc-cadmium efflux system protein